MKYDIRQVIHNTQGAIVVMIVW